MTKSQQEILTNEMPPVEIPAQVQNGFALVNFVDATLERDKEDNGFILYKISLPLSDEHKKYVPRKVRKSWDALLECDMKRAMIKELRPHLCEFACAPDGDDKSLKIEAAGIEKVTLDLIQETGTGKTKEYVRLTFVARMSVSDQTIRFARIHFGHNVWLFWEQAQKELALN